MAYWWGIFIGTWFLGLGAYQLLTGEIVMSREGAPIPAWVGWIELPFGIWVLFWAIRGLLRNRHKPDPVVDLDEEAARAEAELDAMYLREHGEMPEKPKKR